MHSRWYRFDELTSVSLYEILAFRQGILVVEQASAYPDLDFVDLRAWHLLITDGPAGRLAGYLRAMAPAESGGPASFGRIVVAPEARGRGLGLELVAAALDHLEREHPAAEVVIGAQAHLRDFYGRFGFRPEGAPYDDGGIEHIHMRLKHPWNRTASTG